MQAYSKQILCLSLRITILVGTTLALSHTVTAQPSDRYIQYITETDFDSSQEVDSLEKMLSLDPEFQHDECMQGFLAGLKLCLQFSPSNQITCIDALKTVAVICYEKKEQSDNSTPRLDSLRYDKVYRLRATGKAGDQFSWVNLGTVSSLSK